MAAVPRSSSLQEEVVAVEAQPHSSSHRVVVVVVECSTFELQVVAVVAVVAAVGVHYSSLFLLAEGVEGVQPLSQIDEVAMEFL